MRKLLLAEWVLARLTGRVRAAAIVGDLVEVSSAKGRTWLWFSIIRVILAHLWRRPVAFIAAFYAGNWIFSRFQIMVFGIHAQRNPHHTPQPALDILSLISSLLWIASIYSVIRFGLRDRFAQLGLAIVSIMTVAVFYWWQPRVLAACVAAAVSALLLAGRDREGRRTAAALPVMLAIGCGGFLLSCYLEMKYVRFVCPVSLRNCSLQEHPSIGWAGASVWLLWPFIVTSAAALAHRWVTRKMRSDIEESEGSLV